MHEDTPSCAEPATGLEPLPANSTHALIGALVSLATAAQQQTTQLTQLTERLAMLTETLMDLLDTIEAQDDDASAKYETLS